MSHVINDTKFCTVRQVVPQKKKVFLSWQGDAANQQKETPLPFGPQSFFGLRDVWKGVFFNTGAFPNAFFFEVQSKSWLWQPQVFPVIPGDPSIWEPGSTQKTPPSEGQESGESRGIVYGNFSDYPVNLNRRTPCPPGTFRTPHLMPVRARTKPNTDPQWFPLERFPLKLKYQKNSRATRGAVVWARHGNEHQYCWLLWLFCSQRFTSSAPVFPATGFFPMLYVLFSPRPGLEPTHCCKPLTRLGLDGLLRVSLLTISICPAAV